MIDDKLCSRLLSPLMQEVRMNMLAMAGVSDVEFQNGQICEVSSVKLNEVTVFQEALGEVSGRICLSFSKQVAINLSNKIMSKICGENANIKEFNEDAEEALKELLNIILGKATALLEQDNLGLIFEPPVISQDAEQMMEGASEVITAKASSSAIGDFDLLYVVK
ncbi:MAG: chemotaxis protein CheX [Holosporales bacterium]|jgi:CheY-specific phosphatase CheX|nr:chemotaxis protein CheX [Holosporales bacterium]